MSVNPVGSPSLPVGSTEEVLTSIGGKLTLVGVAGGGGGGGNLAAVVFQPDPTTASTSIQSARSANQMPGDASVGMTNLGSDSTDVLPPNTGAYATIGGGDQNVTTTGAAAPNYATVAGGLNNLATNAHATIGGGTGNLATGDGATVPGGNENHASGANALAEGSTCNASGDESHAEGFGTTASGPQCHAEGLNTQATVGPGAHAEGDTCVATGDGAHAEGDHTFANNDGAHAEGLETTASGAFSHAEGNATTAQGNGSSATGEGSFAIWEGQAAHASGYDGGVPPTSITTKQTSMLTLRGTTPGAVAGETVELKFGSLTPPTQTLDLVTGKAYTVSVEAVAQGIIVPAGQEAQSFYAQACVKNILGVATLAGTGLGSQFGDASLAGAALAFSVSGNTLHLSYTNPEAVAAVVDVVARVTVTETN
jgi:hypothetical protein